MCIKKEKSFQNRVYCKVCKGMLGYFKENAGEYKKEKNLCPICNKLEIISKEIVLKDLDYKLGLYQKELVNYLGYSDKIRTIRTILNFREVQNAIGDLDISTEASTTELGGKEINVISFVLMNLGINYFLEAFSLGLKNSTHFDESHFLDVLYKILKVFQEKYSIEQENMIRIKHNGEYWDFLYQISKEYNDSLEIFGLVATGINRPTSELLQIQKNIEKLEDRNDKIHNLYLFSLSLLFLVYSNFPEKVYKSFSFLNIPLPVRKILHDFLIKIELDYKDKVGKNQEDLENGKNFFIGISKKELIEKFKEFFLVSNPKAKNEEIEISFHNIEQIIIATEKNNIITPIFIENIHDNMVYFGPKSIFYFRYLLWASIEWENIKTHFDKWGDKFFTNQILEKLDKVGLNYHDDHPQDPKLLTEIKNKKKNGFEVDIYARFKDFLFIIELKSFRPVPFLNYEKNRKTRFKRCNHFENQIFDENKALDFWREEFKKEIKDPNFRKIILRKKDDSVGKYVPIQIWFNKKFQPKYIVPIFINQLRELPNSLDYKINLIIESELIDFLKHPSKWKKYLL